MNLLISTVMQEKQRIEYMLLKYQEMLKGLPKGTVSQRQVKGNIYYYLKYRNGKKVVSEYVEKDKVEALKQQIERRRHIEAMIKSLLEEQKLADKVLEGNI